MESRSDSRAIHLLMVTWPVCESIPHPVGILLGVLGGNNYEQGENWQYNGGRTDKTNNDGKLEVARPQLLQELTIYIKLYKHYRILETCWGSGDGKGIQDGERSPGDGANKRI